jgi:thiamine pyrophosphate-dependent acetolactate synthase large subunit-like protein
LKVATAVAKILKAEGVDYLIGYPVNPVIEAAAEEDIRPVIVRQERTGLHMADAVSRVTSGEKIGVFAMQYGPGTENAFGGVAQAYGDSVPIVVLPAGYERKLINVRPNFSALLNFDKITKSVEQVISPQLAVSAVRRAFTLARNGRPGPTIVEIPYDIYGEEVEDFTYLPSKRRRSAPDPADVDEVARVLVSADRPVIYAGQGVHYAKAWSPLRELAEVLGAPVCTSLQGKSAFPEDHELALGSGGRAYSSTVRDFLQRADVIFGIGCSFTATPYGVAMPYDKTIIHATLDAADLSKDVPSQYALVGDAKLTLEALIPAVRRLLSDEPARSFGGEIKASRAEWLGVWQHRLDASTKPLSPYRVIAELMRVVDPDEAIITHDAGSPRDQLSPHWVSREPLSYIGWGKTTQLGTGLGYAMGAKLARPDKLCINVWGDAAIGFTGMDFETAVRERLPILSVLLNNFSMAIELPLMRTATEKFRSTDISGDYAMFAKALGGYGERITEPDEISGAIQRGIKATQDGTPALLEFITEQALDLSMF